MIASKYCHLKILQLARFISNLTDYKCLEAVSLFILKTLPQRLVLGEGGCHLYQLLADGMDEGDLPGMQRNAASRIGTRETVFQISLDGATHGGQLATDLMMPARLEIDFEQAVAVAPAHQPVMQDGLFGAGALMIINIRLVLLFVTDQILFQGTLRLSGGVLDDGQVGFVHLAVAEHLVEPRQGLAGTGKDHHSRHGPVQTMRHAQEDIARLVVFFFDPQLEAVFERHITRLVRLHNLGARLVDDDQMVVFVEYRHGDKKKKDRI